MAYFQNNQYLNSVSSFLKPKKPVVPPVQQPPQQQPFLAQTSPLPQNQPKPQVLASMGGTPQKGLFFEVDGKKLYSASGQKYDAVPAEQAPGGQGSTQPPQQQQQQPPTALAHRRHPRASLRRDRQLHRPSPVQQRRLRRQAKHPLRPRKPQPARQMPLAVPTLPANKQVWQHNRQPIAAAAPVLRPVQLPPPARRRAKPVNQPMRLRAPR